MFWFTVRKYGFFWLFTVRQDEEQTLAYGLALSEKRANSRAEKLTWEMAQPHPLQ